MEGKECQWTSKAGEAVIRPKQLITHSVFAHVGLYIGDLENVRAIPFSIMQRTFDGPVPAAMRPNECPIVADN